MPNFTPEEEAIMNAYREAVLIVGIQLQLDMKPTANEHEVYFNAYTAFRTLSEAHMGDLTEEEKEYYEDATVCFEGLLPLATQYFTITQDSETAKYTVADKDFTHLNALYGQIHALANTMSATLDEGPFSPQQYTDFFNLAEQVKQEASEKGVPSVVEEMETRIGGALRSAQRQNYQVTQDTETKQYNVTEQ